MKNKKNIFLLSIDNSIGIHSSEGAYTLFILKLIGISNSNLLKILTALRFPIKILLIIGASLYFFIKLLISIKTFFKPKKNKKQFNDKDVFLFFTNIFYSRCLSAELFENSKYWIIAPFINRNNFNLDGKIILEFKDLLSFKSYLNITIHSFSTLLIYSYKYNCLYPIHKCWSFFEIQEALNFIGPFNTIYFSNQSDRWALLFDQLVSNYKVLIQHGIDDPTNPVPNKLKNITKLYSISDCTSQDMLVTSLDCQPQILIMKPTISLTEIEKSQRKSVLLITHIAYFQIEKEIIDYLRFIDIDIIIKKHPTVVNDSCYRNIIKDTDIKYITNEIFPKVDFVISYFSTLAYEYNAHKVPLYVYRTIDTFSMVELDKKLREIIQQ